MNAPAKALFPAPQQWLQAAGLALLAIAAYLPALQAGFVWDDDFHVTGNALLRSIDGLRRIWLEPTATPQYYPLVHTTFWLEYRLWGLQPAGYHAVNVLLHAVNAVLAWRVLLRLAVPGAWLAAAVFALHPVHVESVAWISERKNVLSLAFYLGALLVWTGAASQPPAAQRRAMAPVLVLFLAALLSKTVACSLPAAMLVLAWWQRGRIRRVDLLVTGPMFVLGLAFGLMTVYLERHHVGAVGEDFNLTLPERLLVAGRALWFYAGKLCWPTNLTFIYERWTLDTHSAAQWAFPLAAAVVVCAVWAARGKLGRGPLAGLLLFGGTLAPALGLIDFYPMRYSFVADHFQYAASLALIALAAAAAVRALEALGPRGRPLGLALCGLALAALGGLTWRQTQAYRDAATLWRDTLAKNPNCWMAWHNLGNLLLHEGRSDEAVAMYGKSLELVGSRSGPQVAQAHCNLARLLQSQAEEAALDGQHARADVRFRQAADHYQAAIRGGVAPPGTHFNLALVLERLGRMREAAAMMRAAAELDPGDSEARWRLHMLEESLK